MTSFYLGLLALIIGYFTYGRFIEKILKPDNRPTPAIAQADGVDILPLPMWKNLFIQLLNIAGVGPVIGVIIGIKFGAACFWIIPIGCIFGGAVHDYVSGFISLRAGGANLPAITQRAFGKWYAQAYSIFLVILLLLVVAVFINIPANLLKEMVIGNGSPELEAYAAPIFWAIALLVFGYYTAATLFPVDKIIGKLYPFFGALLIIGSAAIFVMLTGSVIQDPALLTETAAFKAGMFHDQPIVPCLFVTIACGILSGFHATQSPIVARTMRTEHQARATYYGMMIAEGLIAMIWAGVGMAVYNLQPELFAKGATSVLIAATDHFLGKAFSIVTVLSIVVLAITSGDTALRSLRLTLAEIIRLPQQKLPARLALTVPLVAVTAALLFWSNRDAQSFEWLWKYFAWGNQVLAASTLLCCTVWLLRRGCAPWVTLLPGMFITFVVTSFILWSDPSHPGCPYGLHLPITVAYAIAGIFTFLLAILVIHLGTHAAREDDPGFAP